MINPRNVRNDTTTETTNDTTEGSIDTTVALIDPTVALHLRFLENYQDFWKITKISGNSGKLPRFMEILEILENYQDFWKILKFLENAENALKQRETR